ncbi:aquaporin [Leucobacter coleopterorum]|uniref:aquaporin n=1 Tax=Leucobacter coleopterorum TaxID=2714933 RepID=UPI001FCB8402|nr:aquaporin [Leucobacter coleopterorum]
MAEALATFLFVFIIIAAVNNVGDLTPLVIGFALMTLVFATGHLSGAHLNPAVSLGIFLRGALSVGTSKDHLNNSFYGLAIGTTVFIGAATVGGISGGGFNPAVAFGLAISGQFAWANLWLYVLAPLVGAAIGAIAFRMLNRHDLTKATGDN